jgi:hypothetical protein
LLILKFRLLPRFGDLLLGLGVAKPRQIFQKAHHHQPFPSLKQPFPISFDVGPVM